MRNPLNFLICFAMLAFAAACSENSTDPQSEKSYIVYNTFNFELQEPDMVKVNRVDINGSNATLSALLPQKNMLLSEVRNGKIVTCEFIDEDEGTIYLNNLQDDSRIEVAQIEASRYLTAYIPISPDGSKVYYVNDDSDYGEIVEFDASSGEKTIVIEGITSPWLALSPDGEWLAFYTYSEDDPKTYLYKCRIDGSELEKLSLTEINDFDDGPSQISWSPDGEEILVDMREGGYLIVKSDGSAETEIPGNKSLRMTFSPISNQIVFDNYNEGNIYLKESPSAAPELLISSGSDTLKYLYPIWSKDGNGVVFMKVNLVERAFTIATYDLDTKKIMDIDETKTIYAGDNFDDVQFILPMLSKPYWVR
ncbi:MAG: TolB family protein [Candidatus Kapaibacterium sp.]